MKFQPMEINGGAWAIVATLLVLSLSNAQVHGSSLAFVIDVTGSMGDDIEQVKIGSVAILNAALANPQQILDDFLVVPFRDPDVETVTQSKDSDVIAAALASLAVHGGGDCPEVALAGIKKALELSQPRSYIYVFTDAAAKDYELLDEVLELVQHTQSKIVFVMTGKCGADTDVGFTCYIDLAAASSGELFVVEKDEVDTILETVIETTLPDDDTNMDLVKLNLLSLSFSSAGSHSGYQLPIDQFLDDFTISLSGSNPTLEVYGPDGHLVPSSSYTVILNLENVYTIKFTKPAIGIWTVKFSSTSFHTLRITDNLDSVELTLLYLSFTSAGSHPGHTHTLVIDSLLEDFTIALSGTDPVLEVIEPNGTPAVFTVLVSHSTLYIIKFSNPVAGNWTLKFSSTSFHRMRVTGIDFENPAGWPVSDVPTYVYINCTGLPEGTHIQMVKLLSLEGEVLESKELHPSGLNGTIFYSDLVLVPDYLFTVVITGVDASHSPFTRSSKSFFVPQRPKVEDECTLGKDNCGSNATCLDTSQYFQCECNEGYTGDGVICVDNLESTGLTLLYLSFPSPGSNSGKTLLVDSFITDFTITLSGTDPVLEVLGPNGQPVSSSTYTVVLNQANIYMIKFANPVPGTWTLSFSSTSFHMIRVTGTSTFDFDQRFGNSYLSIDFINAAVRPISGIATHVYINCTGLVAGAHLQTVSFISLEGEILRNGSLHVSGSDNSIYFSDLMVVPQQQFNVLIFGVNEDNVQFTRSSKSAINGIEPIVQDECSLDKDNCGMNGQCVDTPKSFQCNCKEGYAGDGVICIDNLDSIELTLLYLSFTSAGSHPGHTHTLVIDSLLEDFTIALSGTDPVIELIEPNGTPAVFTVLVSHSTLYIIKFSNPVAGNWTLKFSSSSFHRLRVTGTSMLDIEQGFGNSYLSIDFENPAGWPVSDVPTYVYINCTGLPEGTHIQMVKLLSLEGEVLESKELHPSGLNGTIFYSDLVLVPDYLFTVVITGVDASHSPFTRSSKSFFVPQRPKVEDECTLGKDNCGSNATCLDTSQYFQCKFNEGYTGDGVICIDNLESVGLTLLYLSFPSPGRNSGQTLVVDSFLTDFTITLSGTDPLLEVLGPNGQPVSSSTYTVVLNQANIYMIKFANPVPGTWTFSSSSTSFHKIRVTGTSSLALQQKFGNSHLQIDFRGAHIQPFSGVPMYIYINCTGLIGGAYLQKVNLIDSDGEILLTRELVESGRDNTIYFSSDSFVMLNQTLMLQIIGVDGAGDPIIRTGNTQVIPVEPIVEDECESDKDNCDESATCIDTANYFQCTCDDGYSGDGVVCDYEGDRVKLTLLSLSYSSAGRTVGYPLFIGSSSKDLTITLIGLELELRVFGPDGQPISSSAYTVELSQTNLYIIKFTNPVPGDWALTFSASSSYTLTVTGTSTLSFTERFSNSRMLIDLVDAATAPYKGAPTYIYISCFGLSGKARLQSVSLVSNSGETLVSRRLHVSLINDSIYYSDIVIVPQQTFKLMIFGVDPQEVMFASHAESTIIPLEPNVQDECALEKHNCNGNATCLDTPESFHCECNAGYTGDGVVCHDGQMVAETSTSSSTSNSTGGSSGSSNSPAACGALNGSQSRLTQRAGLLNLVFVCGILLSIGY